MLRIIQPLLLPWFRPLISSVIHIPTNVDITKHSDKSISFPLNPLYDINAEPIPKGRELSQFTSHPPHRSRPTQCIHVVISRSLPAYRIDASTNFPIVSSGCKRRSGNTAMQLEAKRFFNVCITSTCIIQSFRADRPKS